MKNNNPLISVILPVYNVEKYILQCLESISNQTYTKLEVIIVVDGATDKSYKIAKDYLEKDNRFHLIYQENAGSGPARNNGLNHANGEFVIFIDPDDWIKNDYIETLYKIYLANNVDLVITSGTDIFFDNQDNIIKKIHKDIPEIKLNTKEEARDNYIKLYSLNMLSGPAQKLYRMEIIRKYNIEFPALRRSQDIVFNYRYYNHINSLKSINYQGYQYRINKSSYASKLPENYYCIIGQIYSEIKSLHDSCLLYTSPSPRDTR